MSKNELCVRVVGSHTITYGSSCLSVHLYVTLRHIFQKGHIVKII